MTTEVKGQVPLGSLQPGDRFKWGYDAYAAEMEILQPIGELKGKTPIGTIIITTVQTPIVSYQSEDTMVLPAGDLP